MPFDRSLFRHPPKVPTIAEAIEATQREAKWYRDRNQNAFARMLEEVSDEALIQRLAHKRWSEAGDKARTLVATEFCTMDEAHAWYKNEIAAAREAAKAELQWWKDFVGGPEA